MKCNALPRNLLAALAFLLPVTLIQGSTPAPAASNLLPKVADRSPEWQDTYVAGSDGIVGVISGLGFHRYDVRQHGFVQTPTLAWPHISAVHIPEWRAFVITASQWHGSSVGAKYYLLGCRSAAAIPLPWLDAVAPLAVIAGKGSILTYTNSGSTNSLNCYDEVGTLVGSTTGLDLDVNWGRAAVDISGRHLVAIGYNAAASYSVNTTCLNLPGAPRGQFSAATKFNTTDSSKLAPHLPLQPTSEIGIMDVGGYSSAWLATNPLQLLPGNPEIHFLTTEGGEFGNGSVRVHHHIPSYSESSVTSPTSGVSITGEVEHMLFTGAADGYLAVIRDPGFTPAAPPALRRCFMHLDSRLASSYTGPLVAPAFVWLRQQPSYLGNPPEITVAWAAPMGNERTYIQRRQLGQTDADWVETLHTAPHSDIRLSHRDTTFARSVAYEYRVKVTQGTETAYSPIASISPPVITTTGIMQVYEWHSRGEDRWVNLLGNISSNVPSSEVTWETGVTFANDAAAAQNVLPLRDLVENEATHVQLPLQADLSVPATYYIWARARTPFMLGSWKVVAEHSPTAPPAPQTLSLFPSAPGNGEVQLRVESLNGGNLRQDYEVAFTDDFASPIAMRTVGPGTTLISNVRAAVGQQIYMRVRNRNAFYASPWSQTLTFTPWYTPLAPELQVLTTAQGSTLQWSLKDPNAQTFVIEGRTPLGTWSQLAEIPRTSDAAATSMTYDFPMNAGQAMEFRMRAKNPTWQSGGSFSAGVFSRMNVSLGTGFAVYARSAAGTRTTRVAPVLASMRPTLSSAKTSQPAILLRNLATGEYREIQLAVVNRRKQAYLGPILASETQHQAYGVKANEMWQIYHRAPDPLNVIKNRMESYSGLLKGLALKSAPTDVISVSTALTGTFEGWAHEDVTVAVPKSVPAASTNATRLHLDTGSISLKLNLTYTEAVRTLPEPPSWENATAKVLATLAASGYVQQTPPALEATTAASVPASIASTSGVAAYAVSLKGTETLWLEPRLENITAAPYVKAAKVSSTGFLLRDLATKEQYLIATFSEYGYKFYYYALAPGSSSLSNLPTVPEEGKLANFRTAAIGAQHTALLVGQRKESEGRVTHDVSYLAGDIVKPVLLPVSRISLLLPTTITGRELSLSTGRQIDPRELDSQGTEYLTQGLKLSRLVRKEAFSTVLTDKVQVAGDVFVNGSVYRKGTIAHALVVVTQYLSSKGYIDLRQFE